jgi:hypothetical protein
MNTFTRFVAVPVMAVVGFCLFGCGSNDATQAPTSADQGITLPDEPRFDDAVPAQGDPKSPPETCTKISDCSRCGDCCRFGQCTPCGDCGGSVTSPQAEPIWIQ